jgi:hypothetical protein
MRRSVTCGFIALAMLVAAGCTNTAAIYEEVQQLRNLPPSFTNSGQQLGKTAVTYTGFLAKDGELKRVLAQSHMGDTVGIEDYYFDQESGIYWQHLVIVASDTLTNCTYFFRRGKCVKRWCINAEQVEEIAAEEQISQAYNSAKQRIDHN